MAGGEQTRAAVASQPEWLRAVPTGRRLPPGSVAYTGCGTSFHAAQTGGYAVEALEAVLAPPPVDTLVIVSHEGTTPLSLEAAQVFGGHKVLVTGAPESTLADVCDEVVVATPEIEQSWCHTASYTCAVTALAALRGEDASWVADAVAGALEAGRGAGSGHEQWRG